MGSTDLLHPLFGSDRMSTGRTKEYEVEFRAILRESSPGQIIPFLLLGDHEQAAPAYGHIVPPEFLIPGQRIIMRKLVKGMRKGVDWEVVIDDNANDG